MEDRVSERVSERERERKTQCRNKAKYLFFPLCLRHNYSFLCTCTVT